ncbi:MAG: hypothetical protein QF835_09070 [Candidatus Marinimicrobia bacterium]|jgi:hypothetical protein|nr:hypothetical protein [Candidatus Neomarinimicrobiota bacterium]MDP6615155.1 hypothetical protein [Candidatus Neomarinimicrobiota bacterium]|tara:strand:+ start:10584 stop:11717 length:1134 start_codon:yes stop_codon:yes gene_type:complete
MKNSTKNFLLLFASLLFCTVIAETIVRLFLPQQLIYAPPDVYQPDSTFGWRYLENTNTVVNHAGAGLVHFRTDEYGYRINATDNKIKNTGNPLNVLILGDSFLAALQVENEKTIPQLLKQDLQSQYTLNVDFYNSAVGGWDPNHYLLEAKKVLKENRLKLDMCLVFLYVSNDIVTSVNTSYNFEQVSPQHSFSIPEDLSWSSFINSVLYPINDFLEVRSHLFIFLKHRFQSILAKFGLTAAYFPDIFLLSEQSSARWGITSGICKNIHDEFQRLNVPVVFILLPSVYQCNTKIFYEHIENFDIPLDSVDLKQPNELLAEYFQENRIELHDPLFFMQKQFNHGYTMYGKIDGHFNEEGHRVVADYVLPLVLKNLKKEQ